jgi:hypothetical protein
LRHPTGNGQFAFRRSPIPAFPESALSSPKRKDLCSPEHSKLCFLKYKIEFLPVELQGFKKKKITMGNDIETSEPLWFALFFHCLK